MILKCNACRSNVVLFGEWEPGRIVECNTCHKGVAVIPGQLKKRRHWWQKRDDYVNALRPESRIPMLNGRGYNLEEALEQMKKRPNSLWAPAGRLRYGMCCAYAWNGDRFIAVGHDDKPGNGSGPDAKLPLEAGVEDWYELDPAKFYTCFFHWEDRVSEWNKGTHA